MGDSKFDDDISKWLLAHCYTLLKQQGKDGSWPGGVNGPYDDFETPVRNTAHIAILMISIGRYFNDAELLDSAHKAADYLINLKNDDGNTNLVFREKIGKDKTNGVIGPAWLIESLSVIGKYLNRLEATEYAKSIFWNHPFNEKIFCWGKLQSGQIGSLKIDNTFNHQLWFASSACDLNDQEINKLASRFIEKNLLRVELYRDGVVYHGSVMRGCSSLADLIFDKKMLKQRLKLISRKKSLRSKSVGYHSFNLYAMVRIYEMTNKREELKRLIFKLLQPLQNKKFYCELNKSLYGWDYNHPNIEYYYIFKKMNIIDTFPSEFKHNFFQSLNDYVLDSCDRNTASARMYELARLFL